MTTATGMKDEGQNNPRYLISSSRYRCSEQLQSPNSGDAQTVAKIAKLPAIPQTASQSNNFITKGFLRFTPVHFRRAWGEL
jgi:hypothetical protein